VGGASINFKQSKLISSCQKCFSIANQLIRDAVTDPHGKLLSSNLKHSKEPVHMYSNSILARILNSEMLQKERVDSERKANASVKYLNLNVSSSSSSSSSIIRGNTGVASSILKKLNYYARKTCEMQHKSHQDVSWEQLVEHNITLAVRLQGFLSYNDGIKLIMNNNSHRSGNGGGNGGGNGYGQSGQNSNSHRRPSYAHDKSKIGSRIERCGVVGNAIATSTPSRREIKRNSKNKRARTDATYGSGSSNGSKFNTSSISSSQTQTQLRIMKKELLTEKARRKSR